MSAFRHPHTASEHRANTRDAGFVRAKRRGRNLPTAWDDIQPRSQRSWKAHRRQHWTEQRH